MVERRKTLAEGKHIGLYEERGWEWAARPEVSGVVGILPITRQGNIILVEQFRLPVDAAVIEIPAGVVGDKDHNRHESARDCAHRELVEETGYDAGSLQHLGFTPSSAGLTSEIVHLFLATELTQAHEGGGVGSEAIVVHTVPKSELHPWLVDREEHGILIDFKIMASLWLAEARGLI
jgi:ADP-ribose pyrophosphatase